MRASVASSLRDLFGSTAVEAAAAEVATGSAASGVATTSPTAVPTHASASAPLVSEEDSYLDCVMLHSTLDALLDTLRAWHALEEVVPHPVRYLGISNVGMNNLKLLYDLMEIKPAVKQNCFCREQGGYDARLRGFCMQKGIVYQAWGILKKNPHLLA